MSERPSEQDIFYKFVEKHITRDIFNSLWGGFQQYEDGYKRDIIFNVCRTIEISNRIGFEDDLLDGLQLVQVTSIIELLTKRQEYLRFDKWYNQNAEKYKNKNCGNAWHDYNRNHGITKNFRNFFLGLETDEKFELLCTIKKKFETFDGMHYLCYQGEKCDYTRSICQYNAFKEHCLALNDERILDKGIKALADHLYRFRSRFVHARAQSNLSNNNIIATDSIVFFINSKGSREVIIKINLLYFFVNRNPT